MTKDIEDKKPQQMDDRELLAFLKKKVDGWYTYFTENIIRGNRDKKFAYGDQWEAQVALEYKNTGKVMLTTNKLNPYVRRIVGEVITLLYGFTAKPTKVSPLVTAVTVPSSSSRVMTQVPLEDPAALDLIL